MVKNLQRKGGGLIIVHVNLAKGFRGGERQTAILIEALASQYTLQQILVCRDDSPLKEIAKNVDGLKIVSANNQLAGHALVDKADIVHAHEAKAVHWACLHRLLRGTPYLQTRRVDTEVKNKFTNRWCYGHAARRIAISRSIQNKLRSRGWGEVNIIPDASASLPRLAENTKAFRSAFPGKFLVGHAGALVDRTKGQRVLLEAAKRLESRAPDMHFVFLGDGEDRAKLLIESADQGNISWLGFKSNIGDYLAGLDVFAFPSHHEGLGSVLLDVMDVGVPIIASEVGGIPDVVHHDRTGLLFPDGDSQALAEGLYALYRSERLRNRLSATAKSSLCHFSAAAMANSYFTLYRSIVG